MAHRLLIVLAMATAVATDSVSHVSFTIGDQKPISYEVRPDTTHYPHQPPPRSYPTRAPPKYTTQSTESSTTEAYDPPVMTHAPSTTPAPIFYTPRYEPTTTPAPTYSTTTTKAPIYHPQPAYHPKPAYKPTSAYHHRPAYKPAPSYHPRPSYKHHEPKAPACSELTNATYCLEDEEYPEYEVKHAIQYHLDKFNSLYADVADLDTAASVERPNTLEEETYLCSSETAYIRPLRALNTDGKWRVIVNEIQLHYKTFTQTTRVEDCLTAGDDCPKVPMCYESKCLQKFIYHSFLVYDSYDQYFPFAIETFKLPASCACLLGAYTIDH